MTDRIDKPLKTLTAARDMADKLKKDTTGVTVYLRAGTYYLTAPIEFAPKNSGTATAPNSSYAAYQNEKPVLSGADQSRVPRGRHPRVPSRWRPSTRTSKSTSSS